MGPRMVCVRRLDHEGLHTDRRGYQWAGQAGPVRLIPPGIDIVAFLDQA